MRKYKKANYNSNPNYLDFLTALKRFFTNDQDIIPIIDGFNFYVNGIYGTPFTDLFRMYDENKEDIHGPEKTKQLIDDGTIGIIDETIYKQGRGSMLTALEITRVYLEDRRKKYNIGFNPLTNSYTEALKPVINVLPDANPNTTTDGVNPNLPALPQTKPKKKSFWKYLSFLSYKQKAKNNSNKGPIYTGGGSGNSGNI